MERQPKDFVEDKAKQEEVAPPPWENFTRSNLCYGKTPAGKPTLFNFSSHYYSKDGKGNHLQNKMAPSSRNIAKETKEARKLRLSGVGLTYVSLGMITLPKELPTTEEAKKEKSFLTPKEYRLKYGKKKRTKKAAVAPTPNRGPKAPARKVKKDRSDLNQVQIIKAVKTDRTISAEELKQPTKAERKAERKKFLLLRQKQTKKTQARKAVVRAKRLKEMKERISEICGDWHSIATDWRFLQLLDSNLIQGDC